MTAPEHICATYRPIETIDCYGIWRTRYKCDCGHSRYVPPYQGEAPKPKTSLDPGVKRKRAPRESKTWRGEEVSV